MNLSEEWTLAQKLMSLGEQDIFAGDTHFEKRREVARALTKRWIDVTFTIRQGKRITMKQQFERAYQCDL